MTETHRVRDLAELVARHDRRRDRLAAQPAQGGRRRTTSSCRTTSSSRSASTRSRSREGLLSEVVDVAQKYAYRVDRSRVPAVSAWTKEIAARVERDPESGRRIGAAPGA